MAWTTPRTWVSGEVVTAALLNTHLRDQLDVFEDQWASYTPTWGVVSGTAPTIGNGSRTGAYMQAGKLVHGWAKITAGSTTTYGSGIYTISLPVAARTGTPPMPIGQGAISNSGVSDFYRFVLLLTTTTVILRDPSAADWTPTTPFTFGNTDFVALSFTYEAA